MQVLLVTGGSDSSYNYLSSTELLLPSATSWSYSAALPSARGGLRGITLDNKVVITGTNMSIMFYAPSNITLNTLQGDLMASTTLMTFWSFLQSSKSGTILG